MVIINAQKLDPKKSLQQFEKIVKNIIRLKLTKIKLQKYQILS